MYVNCVVHHCRRQRKHGPRYRTDLNVGRDGADNDVDVMFDAQSGSVRLDGSRGFQNIMYRDDKEKVSILCMTFIVSVSFFKYFVQMCMYGINCFRGQRT